MEKRNEKKALILLNLVWSLCAFFLLFEVSAPRAEDQEFSLHGVTHVMHGYDRGVYHLPRCACSVVEIHVCRNVCKTSTQHIVLLFRH